MLAVIYQRSHDTGGKYVAHSSFYHPEEQSISVIFLCESVYLCNLFSLKNDYLLPFCSYLPRTYTRQLDNSQICNRQLTNLHIFGMCTLGSAKMQHCSASFWCFSCTSIAHYQKMAIIHWIAEICSKTVGCKCKENFKLCCAQ